MIIDTSFLGEQIKNTAIIIRHADRDHIPDGVHHSTININENGQKNSKLLGSKFMCFDSIKIFCSPIPRCKQTGEIILEGANKQGQITESNMLGEPGPFVFDKKLAKVSFNNCKGAVEKQIEGEVLPGVRPLKEGSENLKNFVISEMNKNSPSNLLIFITHDAIIAPFIYYYTKEKFNEEHWIGFADGVALIEEECKFYMIRNEVKYGIH